MFRFDSKEFGIPAGRTVGRMEIDDATVSSFGRNDVCLFRDRENRLGQRRRFRLEITGRRRMVVTLGILRCAQNDGKDL
jgi:hypothetical protein